jgi:hypothetical protein
MQFTLLCCNPSVQVVWILYNVAGAHYDALLPASNIDKLAVLTLQKGILQAVRQEAREAKVRARQLRPMTLPPRSGPPAEGADMLATEDEGDADAREQYHQGIDADGIVRDLAAYLEGAPSVVRKRLPLVFPLQASEANSNVRLDIRHEMLPA